MPQDGQCISISAKNKPLREILDRITTKTGYRIEVNSNLLDIPINGNFNKITLPELIRRILKDYNTFVLHDKLHKIIIIKSNSIKKENTIVFSNNNDSEITHVITFVKKEQHNQSSLNKYILQAQDDIEAYPGVTYQEVKYIQDELNQDIIKNPTLVMASPRKTYQEIIETQKALDIDLKSSSDSFYANALANQKKADLLLRNNTVEAFPGVSYQELLQIQSNLDSQLRKP